MAYNKWQQDKLIEIFDSINDEDPICILTSDKHPYAITLMIKTNKTIEIPDNLLQLSFDNFNSAVFSWMTDIGISLGSYISMENNARTHDKIKEDIIRAYRSHLEAGKSRLSTYLKKEFFGA